MENFIAPLIVSIVMFFIGFYFGRQSVKTKIGNKLIESEKLIKEFTEKQSEYKRKPYEKESYEWGYWQNIINKQRNISQLYRDLL
jgi:divalent metal cation (Fe/Co/Zn/Cd) transporter